MCDTIIFFKEGEERSFFAKNSDRDPAEEQVVYLADDPLKDLREVPYLEAKRKYLQGPWENLQEAFKDFQHPYSAVISRPIWIWGAEMGINEKGVAIGNEAVFSRAKLSKKGLLGMDILRLALHNASGAREAVEIISRLLKDYGQGGDGGYRLPLKYHNSFLVKDPKEGYLVETSGQEIKVKEVKQYSISNAYTMKDFKENYEQRLLTAISRGEQRQRFTAQYLENNELSLESLFSLLRSHHGGKTGSVCMHSGLFLQMETTSSLVVDYKGEDATIWYTASPNPCLSLYQPFNKKLSLSEARQERQQWKRINQGIVQAPETIQREIKSFRDRVEARLSKIIAENIQDSSNIFSQLEEIINNYRSKVEELLLEGKGWDRNE